MLSLWWVKPNFSITKKNNYWCEEFWKISYFHGEFRSFDKNIINKKKN